MQGADVDDAADLAVLEAVAALSLLRVREHPSAAAWLRAELESAEQRGRPVAVAVLRERARAAGWSWSAVQRARAVLEAVTVRRPLECWRLPLARER